MNNTPLVFRYVRPLLALIIVVLSFGYVYLLAYRAVPLGNRDILNVVLGLVLGIASSVTTYYFGSSKDKSDQEQATRQPNTTVTQSTTVEDTK